MKKGPVPISETGPVPIPACVNRTRGLSPLLLMLAACASQEAAPEKPVVVAQAPIDAASSPAIDAPDALADAPSVPEDATLIAPTIAQAEPVEPEVWLKGSTHVHARPSCMHAAAVKTPMTVSRSVAQGPGPAPAASGAGWRRLHAGGGRHQLNRVTRSSAAGGMVPIEAILAAPGLSCCPRLCL